MVIPEYVRNTWHQLHCGRRNIPRQDRTIACTHAKTHHQSVLWPMVQKGQRQVGHHLCDRSQESDSDAIHQQPFISPLPSRDDRSSTVPKHYASRELFLVTFRSENENQDNSS